MLATLADAPLTGRTLVYEPKYDGIRALIEVTPLERGPRVRVWSRNGNDKTFQFPAIVAALEALARRLDRPIILDGEIVALDDRGRPAGFQRLQGRIHLTGAADLERVDKEQPTAFIAFDFLRDGTDDLCPLPLRERRERLESLFDRTFRVKSKPDTIRISEQVAGDGRALHARALKEHWEGLIAKDASSVYQVGRRSPAWRKIKVVHEQEFVVGGWTAPRQTRQYFGALLLGLYDAGIARLRRPHRHRLRSQGAGASLVPPEGARDREVAVRHADQIQRTATLGAPGSRRSGEVHRVDRRWQAPASGVPGAA